MNKIFDKNFLMLFGLFSFAIFLRIVFDKNPYNRNILAAINILSLWYVIYCILDSANKEFSKLLKKNKTIGEKIKIKKKKYFKKNKNLLSMIILVIGLLYMIFFANSITNDILGLIALFLSIESDCLDILIAEIFSKQK